MIDQQRRKQWARDREKERFLVHIKAIYRSKGEPLDVQYTNRTWERWQAADRLLGYYRSKPRSTADVITSGSRLNKPSKRP